MLKVWLYAFALKVKSTRKLEQRLQECSGFRYLAGGCEPDHKTLSEFLRVHRGAIVELLPRRCCSCWARGGAGRVGEVAIDSTRLKGNASRDRVVQRKALQRQVQSWMDEVEDDPDRQPGGQVMSAERQRVLEQLQQLAEMGEEKMSLTDPEARFLRTRQGFELGYTGEIAVSEDHFMDDQRVTQNKTDNASLLPMVEEVERQCRERPRRVVADSGFFSTPNVQQLEARGVEGGLQVSNLASELNGKRRAEGLDRGPVREGSMHQPCARSCAARRAGGTISGAKVVEPMIGSLKEHRRHAQVERRGLALAGVEFALAAIALNLKRWYRVRQA